MSIKDFGYLGDKFQIQLLNNLILYKNFAKSIIDVIAPEYFQNKYYRVIMELIKNYYEEYEHIPPFNTLEQLVKSEITSESVKKIVIDTLSDIQNVDNQGYEFVQDKSLKFCKQQELQKAIVKAQKVIDKGDFENYDDLEELVSKALQVGEIDTNSSDVFDDLEEVLSEDYRHPIPMGIGGIDRLLKGGLAKGEIGVILAPTGVGKTTILSKIANNAYNNGYNVLQIFFEDNKKVIQRKHYTMWTGVAPDDLPNHREAVIDKVKRIKSKNKNTLTLTKFQSDSMTIQQIKNYVRKLIADGTKIDLIVLDYIDCIVSDSSNSDEWKSEGSIMRSFESMCSELDIAGWTAVQGNRASIGSEVVTTDQMGGSIKKAQVGHIIISVAKTLQQKEMKLATMAITKSRIGKDGIVFENCKFDNEFLEIDTEQTMTFLGLKDKNDERRRMRLREVLDQQQRQNQ